MLPRPGHRGKAAPARRVSRSCRYAIFGTREARSHDGTADYRQEAEDLQDTEQGIEVLSQEAVRRRERREEGMRAGDARAPGGSWHSMVGVP